MVQYYEEAEDGTVDSADCDNAECCTRCRSSRSADQTLAFALLLDQPSTVTVIMPTCAVQL